MNMDKYIARLEAAMRAFGGYDEKGKRELELAGKAFFRAWMTRHGLKGKVTYNPAGVAVAGDIGCQGDGWEASILHWAQFGQPIMFRTRKQVAGKYSSSGLGMNHWFSLQRFTDITPADIGVKENS